ncbi:MAG TPA: hypothetical protein VFS37_01935, partial [Conexibacter sp.]|nr:hypothetical protein [Conexibacter sp.]
GAGAYFVGGSGPDNMPAVFFPWALSLALLTIPAVRAIRGGSLRRPPLAAAACVFFFAIMVCSLAQTPLPWDQLDRLGRTAPRILARPYGQAFVAAHTRPGERVAILGMLSHRIGFNVGVVNVSPYSNSLVIATPQQLEETIAMLRAEGGRKVFLDFKLAADAEIQGEVEKAGFDFAGADPTGRTGLWIDRRGR